MKLLEKITRRLLSKQPHIKEELLKEYLDKKVVSVGVNQLNDFRDGESIHFKEVILYQSIINSCYITADDGVIVVGSQNSLSQNVIQTKGVDRP